MIKDPWDILRVVEMGHVGVERDAETGKPKSPMQEVVAEALDDMYGHLLLREGDDVFIYNGTHWAMLSKIDFEHFICRTAQALVHGRAKVGDLNAYYKLFIQRLDTPPWGISLHKSNPMLANFSNGTLELKHASGKYTQEFREHSKSDYINWVLDHEYVESAPENPMFRSWLANAFGSDPDGQGKLRAIAQIGGACLVSAFPRIVFLHGEAGTGKSTFAKLCASFIGDNNVSSLEPGALRSDSFLMESLIGKRVNVVSDVSGARFDSAVFKRIEDGVPVIINRKNRPAVVAHIPLLHIFCANKLPRGMDGESSAMDRRLTLVEFTKNVGTTENSHIRDYDKELLAAGSGDILRFFLDGLADLCASGGKYFNPDSGKERLKEWKIESDILSLFFEAIEEGDFPNIQFGRDLSMRGGVIYDALNSFAKARSVFSVPRRKNLYNALREKQCLSYQDRKNFTFFKGIGDSKGYTSATSADTSADKD